MCRANTYKVQSRAYSQWGTIISIMKVVEFHNMSGEIQWILNSKDHPNSTVCSKAVKKNTGVPLLQM